MDHAALWRVWNMIDKIEDPNGKSLDPVTQLHIKQYYLKLFYAGAEICFHFVRLEYPPFLILAALQCIMTFPALPAALLLVIRFD